MIDGIVYDSAKIAERLKKLRKERWNLYKGEEKEKTLDSMNKYYRYKCCETQTTFAKELKIDRKTVGAWETGVKIPPTGRLVEICHLLDCTVDYLLGAPDMPELDAVTKASFYSKICKEIIEKGLADVDFLDCINYFMHPHNSSLLFENITKLLRKNTLIEESLSKIKEPLLGELYKIFNEFLVTTSFDNLTKGYYLAYLRKHLPKEKLVLTSKKEGCINIKKCLNMGDYLKLIDTTNELKYEEFLRFVAETTFEPFMQKATIPLHEQKITNEFIELCKDYLHGE